MIIRIETRDQNLFSDLEKAIDGPNRSVPENCIVRELDNNEECLHAIGGIEIISFVAGVGTGVASNLLSNWLWQIIQNRITSIQIDNKKVELNPNAIEININNIIIKK